MRVLGFVFIGLSVLLLLVQILFAPEVPMSSEYRYTSPWLFVIMTSCIGAGLALLLADWNVRRQRKGSVKH